MYAAFLIHVIRNASYLEVPCLTPGYKYLLEIG